MAEYIEREALGIGKCNPDVFEDKGYAKGWNSAIDIIQNAPAANVRHVVRGKWKPRDLTWGRSYYYCSACEETVDMPTEMGIPMFRYCPNCGARMEES